MSHPTGQNQPALDGLSVDELCRVLGAKRRRLLIEAVAEMESPTRGELTEYIAEAEYGPDYDAQERKSAYVSIYQIHIPLLTDHDVLVESDGSMAAGPNHAGILDCLEDLQRRVDGGGQ